jgi:hypothetical protein
VDVCPGILGRLNSQGLNNGSLYWAFTLGLAAQVARVFTDGEIDGTVGRLSSVCRGSQKDVTVHEELLLFTVRNLLFQILEPRL